MKDYINEGSKRAQHFQLDKCMDKKEKKRARERLI